MNSTTDFEVWKDVEGYEGLYQVSNKGRVKGLKRIVKHNAGNYRIQEEKIRKLYKDIGRTGYAYVNLCKEGVKRRATVHRLVANAFIPNPNELPEVNHLDENKLNNVPDNLQWCTRKENENHGTKKREIPKKQGSQKDWEKIK